MDTIKGTGGWDLSREESRQTENEGPKQIDFASSGEEDRKWREHLQSLLK